MLFSAGAIDRQGRVEDAQPPPTSIPEEVRRGISIRAAIARSNEG
jgi:translation elongation factor EF-G